MGAGLDGERKAEEAEEEHRSITNQQACPTRRVFSIDYFYFISLLLPLVRVPDHFPALYNQTAWDRSCPHSIWPGEQGATLCSAPSLLFPWLPWPQPSPFPSTSQCSPAITHVCAAPARQVPTVFLHSPSDPGSLGFNAFSHC